VVQATVTVEQFHTLLLLGMGMLIFLGAYVAVKVKS
jgi:hypothetical protein